MDSHGAKRPAERNLYEQLAKKIWRPNVMATQSVPMRSAELSAPAATASTPAPAPAPPTSEPDTETLHTSADATTIFLSEVQNALYGDTTGHPEHGSFSYHKAAEKYALYGDEALSFLKPKINCQMASPHKSQPPPGFERAAKALYDRNQAAQAAHAAHIVHAAYSSRHHSLAYHCSVRQQTTLVDGYIAGRASVTSATSINELSQMYLQLLHHKLPQQQHLIAGGLNMSMPIYGMTSGNVNDISQVYAQLLAANMQQNATQHRQHQQLQKQQQVQVHQHQSQSANADAAAVILYEAVLQQRFMQQLQQQPAQLQHQQHQQQQQQQQGQQQQVARTPRGIYGGNYSSGAVNKTPPPDTK